MRENTNVTVICPYEELISYKELNPDRILYHKMDTHWNDLGAYIGTCALFRALDLKWDYDAAVAVRIADTPGGLAELEI